MTLAVLINAVILVCLVAMAAPLPDDSSLEGSTTVQCYLVTGEIGDQVIRVHRYLDKGDAEFLRSLGWEVEVRDPERCDEEIRAGGDLSS